MKTMLRKRKEKIFLLAGLLAVCFFYTVSGIGCPIKWLTGISCAGCGMTRAVFYAAHLQFAEAFYYHPLFWMMPVCAGFVFFAEQIPQKVKKYLISFLAASFFTVYIWRLMNPACQIVTCDVGSSLIARLWKYFNN